MKITAAEPLFSILKKSGLLTADELDESRQAMRDSDDVQAIGARLVETGQLTEWQLKKLLSGQHALFLGKYKLLDRLDWGDSGRVYLAEHTRMRNRVALKTLGRRHGKDSRSLELFKTEGRIAASLDHQNIVKVYDFDYESDYYFFVMEFVEGRDLQHVVEDEGKLSPQQAANYVRQAALGLAHAHSKRVFHGELKPGNLVVDARGTVKIIDLGAAKMPGAEEDAEISRTRFMPPEQSSVMDRIDHLADIYALGGTFFFLLTGEPFLKDGTPAQRLAEQRGKSSKDALGKEVPAALADICARMLAEKPGDRFASADAVAQALQTWLDETRKTEPVVRERPRPRTRSQGGGSGSESSEFPIMGGAPRAAAVDTSDFAIDLKRRKKKSSTAGAQAKAADPKPAVVSASSHTKWIVAAVGTVMLIVAAVVLAIILWPDSTATTVAKQDDAKSADTDEKTADADEEEVDKSNLTEEELEELEAKKARKNGASDEEEETDETDTDDSEAMAATGADLKPEKDPDPNADKPATGGPAAVNPASPAADPTKTPAAATTDPAPTPPPAQPAPPPPPPAKKPFADFAKAMQLPELDEKTGAGAAVVLGVVAGKEPLQVDLLGGEEAVIGKAKFVLSPAGEGWAVDLHDAAKAEGAPVTVAHLSVNKEAGELLFQWTDKAAGHRESNFLRNCVLNLRAGIDTLPLALRTPVEAPQLSTKLGAKTHKTTTKIVMEWMPDPKQMLLEVTGVDGTFPPHEFDKTPPAIDASKGTLHVRCGKDAKIIVFEISTRGSNKGVDLMMSALLQPFADQKPAPLKADTFNVVQTNAMQMSMKIQNDLDAIGKMQQTPKIAKAKEMLTQQQQLLTESIGKLPALEADLKGLHETGGIRYRIYFKVAEQQVDVARSAAAAAAAAAAPGFALPAK